VPQLLNSYKKIGQSVWAAIVNSQPLDNMLRVVTAVQQIMTEFNGAVSEEDKIVAITKTVLNLMKQNGH
jgi:methionine-rich copper-binding protein CopC